MYNSNQNGMNYLTIINNKNFLRKRWKVKHERSKLEVVIVAFVVGIIVAGIVVFAIMFIGKNQSVPVVMSGTETVSGPVAVATDTTKETGKFVFSAITSIDPLCFLWWTIKGIVFFFVFIFSCHGPLVWMGFLFSIKDGMGKITYTKDRILNIKITYYGRHLDKKGDVVEDKKNNFLKLFGWFKNYFFGSLHILGIPGIHRVNKEPYTWERLDPATGEVIPEKGVKGEFPLREFIPVISFTNLDVTGGQIDTKIGVLIKITNPMKTATVARDWFPFFIDIMRGHIRECFAGLDFFRVMISKENFGEKEEKPAEDLSSEIKKYFDSKKNVEFDGKEIPLVKFIERKYGIEILKFYVIDPNPAEASKALLDSISKPLQAKLTAKETVIKAGGEADAFNKKREAMEKPGGKELAQYQMVERSKLITLGDGGKGLNLFVNADKTEVQAQAEVTKKDPTTSSKPTKKKEKGGNTSGNP